MFEINFPRNDESEQDLSESGLSTVFMEFTVRSDGEDLFESLSSGEYYADFFYEFLRTTLRVLPDVAAGEPARFQLEGPFDVLYTPHDSRITISIDVHPVAQDNLTIDTELDVALDVFAQEVIATSREFLDYVHEVGTRPADEWAVEELEAEIVNIEAWYARQFDDARS